MGLDHNEIEHQVHKGKNSSPNVLNNLCIYIVFSGGENLAF